MRGFHDAIGGNFSRIKVFVECCSLLSHMIGLHCIALFSTGQVAGSGIEVGGSLFAPEYYAPPSALVSQGWPG